MFTIALLLLDGGFMTAKKTKTILEGAKSENEQSEQRLSEALFKALSKGRLVDLEAALAEGADASSLDYCGFGALGRAAVRNPGAVAALLAHGADANQADLGGNAPLLIACLHAQEESAGLLLAAGANPNAAGGGWR